MTSIREFQHLMKVMYFNRDSKRGSTGTVLWLISEVGEFAGALSQGDRGGLEDEVADVFAWLCSACNVLGIDLESSAEKKYGGKCPRCGNLPCRCTG